MAEGVCDGCERALERNETLFSCPRDNCEYDLCLPCAGRTRDRTQQEAVPCLPSRPEATSTSAPAEPPALAHSAAAAPPPADPLQQQIADLGARIRERARRSAQPQVLHAFLDWQAERAAERRGEPHPPISPLPVANGAMTAQAVGAITPASGSTPGTGFTLSAPTTITIFPEERGTPLREQVGSVVAAGGDALQLAIAFARELFRQVPSAALADVCDGVYDEMGEDAMQPLAGSGGVEGRPQAAATGPPTQFQVSLRDNRPAYVNVVDQRRCYCCDDRVGRGDGNQCSALELYDTLLEDLCERDRIIQEEQQQGVISLADSRRAARWFMYRTFVAAKYGHLGAGVRVRIPDCVIAAIRSRYRDPACNCAVKDIAQCQQHGYTGHRDE